MKTLAKEWTKQFGSELLDYGDSVTIAADGSVYLAGRTNGDFDGQTLNGVPGSTWNYFISKYKSDGSKVWTTLESTGGAISVDDNGSIYVLGGTNLDLDGIINSGQNAILSKLISFI